MEDKLQIVKEEMEKLGFKAEIRDNAVVVSLKRPIAISEVEMALEWAGVPADSVRKFKGGKVEVQV